MASYVATFKDVLPLKFILVGQSGLFVLLFCCFVFKQKPGVGKTFMRNIFLGMQSTDHHTTVGIEFASSNVVVDGNSVGIHIWRV